MKIFSIKIVALLLFASISIQAQYYLVKNDHIELTEKGASHFARLALKCIGQEFPNKTGHIQVDSTDVYLPSNYHPSFYGCFDWHSSVHGHWMLIRLLKQFPNLPEANSIRNAINKNITQQNINNEVEYFQKKYNTSYERTYGWAWLLKLAQELHNWNDLDGQKWFVALTPLTELIVKRYIDFLPNQTYAIRSGTHPNTAFGLSFALDYAQTLKNVQLEQMIKKQSLQYYFKDKNCPVAWEPSGADFFSPCLMEAELMSKILPVQEYRIWLKNFIPELFKIKNTKFTPVFVTDRNDLQLVHLDGLNLSRAWCLLIISQHLDGKLKQNLYKLAEQHLEATIPQIADGDYAGEHWLASFAVYALVSATNK